MADEARESVLRRMAAARAAAAGLTAMTPARALRNALAKAGDDVLGTAVGVLDVNADTLVPDDLAEGLPDPALFLMLEGPGGAGGIAVICSQIVAAVIEARTIGAVLPAAAAERRPTRTDAMLVSEFLNPVLEAFGTLAQGSLDPPPVEGFACGLALPDARTSQMMLADAQHLRFVLGLDFAAGAKSGRLVLIFPAERKATVAGGAGGAGWRAGLENAVMGSPARLEAVLCRLRLPLAQITEFAVDDVLPLTGATLDGVALTGADGSRVMTARLGRSGPARAVRLNLDGKPAPPPTVAGEMPPLPAMAPPAGDDAPDPLAMEPAAMTMDAGIAGAADTMAPAPMDFDAEPGEISPQPMELAPQPMDIAALE